ncbi:MAG: 50S ribosomal protein L17 [Candidatus Eisenbacteria bacterium]|nr:50S ribosomal protein L17 [Candidatus Eisenbacteria bacterium]
MRHRKDHRKLSRTSSHRRAVLRNLVTSLFLHERIQTTVAKAKEARRVAERMITFAKRGDVAARRHVARFVMPSAAVPNDPASPDAIQKLFATIAPWYAGRQGGYTRILRLGRRLGDGGEICYLELVKSIEQKEQDRKARIAAQESKEAALKGEKSTKKSKSEASKSEAPVEKPKRGRKKGDGGDVGAPAKRRGKTGVKTG